MGPLKTGGSWWRNVFNKKQEKSQVNNLTLHLKQLEKGEMKNPRVSRMKGILKIRAEINAKETKETIAKLNEAKSWFFERINKIDKPLARLIKKQREKNVILLKMSFIRVFALLCRSCIYYCYTKHLYFLGSTNVYNVGCLISNSLIY